MTRWAVTLLSVAGVLAAVAISVGYGRRPIRLIEREADEVVGAWPGAARSIRGAAVAVFSGAITTALVLGLGGRLMMRIAAATSSESVQGVLTDAEERVGEVSVGGTIGFVLFFTLFFGGVIGAAYGVLRRYLPGPAAFAGLVVAVAIAGIAGPGDFADPDNVDFALLTPTWLIALMLLVLTVLFGTTLGAVYEWLNERVPLPGRRPRVLLAYLPLAPLALMPFNIALVGFAAIGGAATPDTVRDVFRNRKFVRAIGTIAAAAAAYLGVRLAINLASIAT